MSRLHCRGYCKRRDSSSGAPVAIPLYAPCRVLAPKRAISEVSEASTAVQPSVYSVCSLCRAGDSNSGYEVDGARLCGSCVAGLISLDRIPLKVIQEHAILLALAYREAKHVMVVTVVTLVTVVISN